MKKILSDPITWINLEGLSLVSASLLSNSLQPQGLYSLPGSSVHGIFPGKKSGLPFPPQGDLPDPEIEPTPPASPALQGERKHTDCKKTNTL